MYQPRTYRNIINEERFRTFSVSYRESDILVGTDHRSWRQSMARECLGIIISLRKQLEFYGSENPDFLISHDPLPTDDHAPVLIKKMMGSGQVTGTGPMAAVAGLFAFETGKFLSEKYNLSEMLIENGGDLYIKNTMALNLIVHAGNSPLSGRLSLEIPPGSWGISTSSGTVGHSCSYGHADAVTIICKDPILSDAWATSLANKVMDPSDIEKVLSVTETISEILGCMIICKDQVGIRGQFKIKPVDRS
jgi:ApbE superfamily uncharacterized protein (UPF0280 family)